jgi:hypothetical protein
LAVEHIQTFLTYLARWFTRSWFSGLVFPAHAGGVFLLLVHLLKEHHHDRDLDNSLPLAFPLKPVGYLFLSLGEADRSGKSGLSSLALSFTLSSPFSGLISWQHPDGECTW